MNANRIRTLRPLAAAIALALSGPAGAAVIPVDGTACTLADAVSAANTDAATGGCPAGQGDDVLELIADTYALTSPLPAITSRVTILGDPDGNHDKAVIEPDPERDAPDFDMLSVSGGDLKLTNVIVRNGSSGIVAEGGARVELAYSRVSGNRFHGIYAVGNPDNRPSVMVRHTTLSGNRQGLTLGYQAAGTIQDSVISGNTENGVELYTDYADAAVRDSVLTGNCGWGLLNEDKGWRVTANPSLERVEISNNGLGGVAGRTQLKNSTVSGNKGPGDSWGSPQLCMYLDWEHPLGIFTDSTITGNTGGGVATQQDCSGGLELVNTVVSGNGVGDCSGAIPSAHSLIGDGSCEARKHGALTGDAKLGPLQDNGGPTFTHALLKDSPAIDAGKGCAATDQRGATRPQGSSCDLGAYESVTRRPPLLRPLLGFFDQAVQAGTLVGTLGAPNRWHRLQAVRRQLVLAGDLQIHGSKSTARKQTGRALGRIDGDGNTPDKNDYVTGPAAPALADQLRALRSAIGCRR